MARVVAWDRLKHMHDVPTADETLLPPQNTRKLTEPAAPEKEPAAPPPVLREQPLASPAAYPAPVHEVPETEHATTVTVTAEPSVPRRHVPPLRIDVDDDHGLHVRREAQPLKQRNSENAAPGRAARKPKTKAKKQRPPFAMYGWNNDPIGYWKNKETSNVRASREVTTEALHAAVSHGLMRQMPRQAQRQWDDSHHSHIREAPAARGKSAASSKLRAVPAPAAVTRVPRDSARTSTRAPPARDAAAPTRRPAVAPYRAPAVASAQRSAGEHPSALLMADVAVQVPDDFYEGYGNVVAPTATQAPLLPPPGPPPSPPVAAKAAPAAGRRVTHDHSGADAEEEAEEEEAEEEEENAGQLQSSIMDRLARLRQKREQAAKDPYTTEYQASYRAWTSPKVKRTAVAKRVVVQGAHKPQHVERRQAPVYFLRQRDEEDLYRKRY